MHHLLPAPSVPSENILSDRFRVHAVVGDAMEPSLRGGRDYALIAPVTTYEGEGRYLVDFGLGVELFDVTNCLTGCLVLSRENGRYKTHMLEREEFNEKVVGIVIADIRTRNERFLEKAG